MPTYKDSDENEQKRYYAYYEELACQEEIYLEEIEERARAVLMAERPTRSTLSVDIVSLEARCSFTAGDQSPAENYDEQREQAAEDLITGDSDDPPLSDDAVAKMLKAS